MDYIGIKFAVLPINIGKLVTYTGMMFSNMAIYKEIVYILDINKLYLPIHEYLK